ncbi:MAG: hypothetical protein H7Z42_18735 [Roseiflexaceae bacterium]|nr:hypothetical protein [Roseiflexaceae bacterium]
MIGLLHPQIIFSDIGLNANNLLEFSTGEVLFTEGLPSETGGGQSPYPPALYVLAAPLQLLFEPSGEGRLLLLKVLVAALDSAVAWLIWFVLRRHSAAALFAAALYLVPAAPLRSFGVGEFANLAGQSLALPLLAALSLLGGRMREPRVFCLLLLLLMLALLGHAGVTISVILLLGCLGLCWMIVPRTRRLVPALLALGGLAALLVGLFYHSAFAHLLMPPDEVSAALPGLGVGQKLINELSRVFLPPRPTISPLLALLAAAGFVLMARAHPVRGAPGLWLIIVAWLGSALLSIGVLAVRDQTVRWDLFLYPALCIAAGPLLAALWARGLAGKLGAGLALAAILVQGLWFWGWLVFSQYHG